MDTRRRRKQISAAYQYSFAGLVLNYYLYYEGAWETEGGSEEEKRDAEEFGRILGEFLEGRDALEDLDALRKRITKKMEALTGFSDCFQIYEYVLNRMERRFIPMKDSGYTPGELASALVRSIAGEPSSARRNERMQNIVAQLPARFTRQKFYSMIMERLSVFGGTEKDNVEDFLYMHKSSAMVKLPENMDQEKELYEILELLREADYRGMDKDQYLHVSSALSEGSRILMESIDSFVIMVCLVNDLYVLFLTRGEAMVDAAQDQAFRKGAAGILRALQNKDRRLMEEEGEELLNRMEGVQESAEELVLSGGGEDDEILSKVNKLVSGSRFMPLEETKVSHETADQAWIEKQAEEFCRELDQLFAKLPKAAVRAVMAKVLSGLPLVFGSASEAEEYIRSGLESCSDHSERETCMELLEQELVE